MSDLTVDQLQTIYKESNATRVNEFFQPLCDVMDKYEINTPLRMACFLAQVGHESGELRFTHELASGTAYEGRKDLGNTEAGDGVKYKGEGLIQVTGKYNFEQIDLDLNLGCVDNPAVLLTPENATLVAGWFWDKHGLNTIADDGDFEKITKRINGGLNGESDREMLMKRACTALGIDSIV